MRTIILNLAIIPVILGNGRRLFKGDYSTLELHLDSYSVSDGIPVMTYSKRRRSQNEVNFKG